MILYDCIKDKNRTVMRFLHLYELVKSYQKGGRRI